MQTKSRPLGLINLERLELPIRLHEFGRIARNKVTANTWTIVQLGVKLVLRAQLATQINVGNDALILEMRRDITVGVRKVRQRRPPC